jgi:hypothetical protein
MKMSHFESHWSDNDQTEIWKIAEEIVGAISSLRD